MLVLEHADLISGFIVRCLHHLKLLLERAVLTALTFSLHLFLSQLELDLASLLLLVLQLVFDVHPLLLELFDLLF